MDLGQIKQKWLRIGREGAHQILLAVRDTTPLPGRKLLLDRGGFLQQQRILLKRRFRLARCAKVTLNGLKNQGAETR